MTVVYPGRVVPFVTNKKFSENDGSRKFLKILFLAAAIIFVNARALSETDIDGLQITWLGIAGIEIFDGETGVLFDPVVTKPELKHWLTGARLIPDEEAISALLTVVHAAENRAIFISHTHFDHCVDTPRIAEETGAGVYGGRSVLQLLQYYDDSRLFMPISDGVPVTVGRFTVTPRRRDHPPVLSLFDYLPGPMDYSFSGGFYEYREGEVWCYFIEHPAGTVLIDQHGRLFEPNVCYADRVDCYLAGVADKKSVADFVKNNIEKIRPALVVPLHFDEFILKPVDGKTGIMPGMTLDEIGRMLKAEDPAIGWIIPVLHETIVLK